MTRKRVRLSSTSDTERDSELKQEPNSCGMASNTAKARCSKCPANRKSDSCLPDDCPRYRKAPKEKMHQGQLFKDTE